MAMAHFLSFGLHIRLYLGYYTCVLQYEIALLRFSVFADQISALYLAIDMLLSQY